MYELKNNIRAIVLNSNLYNTADEATDGISDPAGQFAWMESVLNGTKNKNEKVSLGFFLKNKILMKVPP